MSDSTLYVLSQAMLGAVEAGTYASPLPDRRYVADGEVAWDFERDGDWIAWGSQVTVRVIRVFPHGGDVRSEVPGVFGIETMMGCEIEVQVLRCAPTVNSDEGGFTIPSPSEIEASAELVLSDAMDVWNAVLAGKRAGDLPGCAGVSWVGWQSVGPAGGLAGGSSTFRLDLAG